MANISQIELPSGDTFDIVDQKSGYITGMTILSYGSSTWSDFIEAYNAKKIVYCRASSNSNPASGSQTRLAFMAYVSNADNPTNVEFQYYRSVSSHTASQQGDQVYVYKLDKTAGWTVTTREASVKIKIDTNNEGIKTTYSSGTVSIGHANSVTAQTTQAIYPIKIDAQGHITSSGTAVTIPTQASDIGAQPTLVSGTNIKTINNNSLLGSGNLNIEGVPHVDLTQTQYDALSSAEKNNGTIYFITDGEPGGSSSSNSIADVRVNNTSVVSNRIANIDLTNKQNTLVSGTNIKTINSTSLLGNGDITVQPTLVSGTNIKTINSTSLLGNGNITVQPTLVSGTNIKTINSTSLLGNGNITVQPTLISGTNIKTINNTSLLGNGNITVQPTLISGTNIKTINNTSLLGNGDIATVTEDINGDISITRNITAGGDIGAAGDVTDGSGNVLANKDTSAWAYMYISSKQLNNTESKITGLTLRGGGNYTDYFDLSTANQIKIKKAGVYHVEIYMRFSSVTNAANVKRISIFKNGASNVGCFGRPNSYEDVTTWDLQTYAVNDVLTMYGRSEDENATVSFPRIFIKPLF